MLQRQILTVRMTLLYMILKIGLVTVKIKCLRFLIIFFGVVHGLITAFDGEHYFCCCSKCITKIRTRYSIQKDFVDSKHDTCPDEINAYFNERVKKEIRGVYIFQTWDLCSDCLLKYFYAIKGDLMT